MDHPSCVLKNLAGGKIDFLGPLKDINDLLNVSDWAIYQSHITWSHVDRPSVYNVCLDESCTRTFVGAGMQKDYMNFSVKHGT